MSERVIGIFPIKPIMPFSPNIRLRQQCRLDALFSPDHHAVAEQAPWAMLTGAGAGAAFSKWLQIEPLASEDVTL